MIFKSIDNLASQVKLYTKYLNMKTKLHKTTTVNCPSQKTEVTSTPTRPVDNVVIATKVLQDKNNNFLMERRWKIKVN